MAPPGTTPTTPRSPRARRVWPLLVLLALAGALWMTCPKGQVAPPAAAPGTAPQPASASGAARPTPAPEIDPRALRRAAISGTVRDDDGRAIAGARVCALTSSSRLDARDTFTPPCATSERDGHYRIDGVWPVRHSVSASAPGHIPAFHVRGGHIAPMDLVDVAPGADLRDIDITLPAGGVEIRGLVKDLSGGSVEGAIVTSGGLFYGTGMAVTTSGPEGAFSLWVRPGTSQVRARAEGYASGTDTGAAPGHGFELFLTPEAVLVGKVVRAGTGAPIEGASVTAQRGDTMLAGTGDVAITDADGNFRLAQLTPGAYKPGAEADDAFGLAREQVVLGLGETSAPIVIEAHPATRVEGVVVVTGGAFCPAGGVTLLDEASGRTVRAELEADGLARMRGMLPGTYNVTIRCEGSIAAEKYPPVVVADQPVTGLRWDVTPGRKIRGTVVTARGEPVAGVSVLARGKPDPARPDARFNKPTSVDADARGRFELAGLIPGHYDLQAFTKGGSARATSDQWLAVTLPKDRTSRTSGCRCSPPARSAARSTTAGAARSRAPRWP